MNATSETPLKKLRVLILEDDPVSAQVDVMELRRAGYEPEWRRVETLADFTAELDAAPELILADFDLPTCTGLQALEVLQQRRLDIPFILVTGALNDATAARCVELGASDCLLKDRLARLGPAVAHALEEKYLRAEARREEHVMQFSELRYRRLFETAPDGILILNARSGQIVDVNPFLLDLLGCTRAELLGRRLWEVPAFQGLAPSADAFAAWQAQDSVHQDGALLATKDGQRCDVEFITSAYLIEGYRVIQCYFRDIRRRRNAERRNEWLMRELDLENAEVKWLKHLLTGLKLQMLKLKQEVNDLTQELGRPPRYVAAPPGEDAGGTDVCPPARGVPELHELPH